MVLKATLVFIFGQNLKTLTLAQAEQYVPWSILDRIYGFGTGFCPYIAQVQLYNCWPNYAHKSKHYFQVYTEVV